jgi:hypothetical protein
MKIEIEEEDLAKILAVLTFCLTDTPPSILEEMKDGFVRDIVFNDSIKKTIKQYDELI